MELKSNFLILLKILEAAKPVFNFLKFSDARKNNSEWDLILLNILEAEKIYISPGKSVLNFRFFLKITEAGKSMINLLSLLTFLGAEKIHFEFSKFPEKDKIKMKIILLLTSEIS